MALDTVAIAQTTPNNSQPFAELGLKPDEYARIKEILGRRPTSSELAMYSVMWSEHCSYKSSKVHLKQFGEKAPKSDALLVGIGENAGVVDVGQGQCCDARILCFSEQFTGLHQPVPQAEPRVAMQMHGARIRRTETLVRLNDSFEHGIFPFQTIPSLRVWRSCVLGKSAARRALTNGIRWSGDLGFLEKWGRH